MDINDAVRELAGIVEQSTRDHELKHRARMVKITVGKTPPQLLSPREEIAQIGVDIGRICERLDSYDTQYRLFSNKQPINQFLEAASHMMQHIEEAIE